MFSLKVKRVRGADSARSIKTVTLLLTGVSRSASSLGGLYCFSVGSCAQVSPSELFFLRHRAKRRGKDCLIQVAGRRGGNRGRGHDFTQREQRQLAAFQTEHRLSGKMSFPHVKFWSAYDTVSQLQFSGHLGPIILYRGGGGLSCAL